MPKPFQRRQRRLALTQRVVQALRGHGYRVGIHAPFKGVDLVRSLGRPARGQHSLQIEVNERLYMDEPSLQKSAGFAPAQTALEDAMVALLRMRADEL